MAGYKFKKNDPISEKKDKMGELLYQVRDDL